MSLRLDPVVKLAFAAQKAAPKLQQLRQSTEDFEAIFIQRMLAEMKKSIGGESGSGFTEGFRQLADEAMSKSFARDINLGIADLLYRNAAPEAIRTELKGMSARNQTS